MGKDQNDSLQAQLDAMKAENAKLIAEAKAREAQAVSRVTWKVSEKGAISLYGIGRFPVTLYPEQWERVSTVLPDVLKFIASKPAGMATPETKAERKAAQATTVRKAEDKPLTNEDKFAQLLNSRAADVRAKAIGLAGGGKLTEAVQLLTESPAVN